MDSTEACSLSGEACVRACRHGNEADAYLLAFLYVEAGTSLCAYYSLFSNQLGSLSRRQRTSTANRYSIHAHKEGCTSWSSHP